MPPGRRAVPGAAAHGFSVGRRAADAGERHGPYAVHVTTDPATTPPGAGPPPADVPLWNIANVLTMVRIVLVPVFAYLMLQGTPSTRMWAAVVFAIAAATDKLDGSLARSRGLVTDFGKLADPIADKALVITALVLLSADGSLPWWVTVVIIVRELGITVLRFFMVRRAVMAASKGGKLKTTLQVAFILLLLVPWASALPTGVADVINVITEVLVLVTVAVTVITGLDYVVQAIRIARAGPSARADAGRPGAEPGAERPGAEPGAERPGAEPGR
ncbi:CDP-diacylglycerol--glycerol-3-phosphate 3-phosphatidyltransferase [Georgenia yuyongxinii]|uniref:CDP-diacylglycerol--glycerol-3-phosphate 3-phosphatidyltransferase n=1 Tax=Georgenia yuyongxinii TaxID=2589797 RepID=A0A5B8C198_9MICO|nr:CDP-diacylglycerol--glycerol-3-phosphate 3-phosphatidyltransferase [Georgenia yuyongxinii]